MGSPVNGWVERDVDRATHSRRFVHFPSGLFCGGCGVHPVGVYVLKRCVADVAVWTPRDPFCEICRANYAHVVNA